MIDLKRVVSMLLLFLTVNVFTPAQADTIFTNFGPGNSYNVNEGWPVCGPAAFASACSFTGNFIQAEAFTPQHEFILGSIELAFALTSGANTLDVILTRDDNGKPGVSIEIFQFTNAIGGPLGQINRLLAADSVLHPTLHAATRYWLVAGSTDLTTNATWNYNSIGETGPHGCITTIGPVGCSNPFDWAIDQNAIQGAFRVSGTQQIPEPTSLVLIIFSLIVLPMRIRGFD